ncbi:mercuric reductase [Legionella waltersii]|uniref:Oxydoreductase n=1 Tax=Legionella waltersii TaxID=66969 RepID=A0A0W1A0V6_9GAMM|nr:mercuric reductase [Legionella waltersii]KTD74988.1 oxydoreductase [Legionella waltersii]SNV08274.1 oxydoreductase [Legionella waltersii]
MALNFDAIILGGGKGGKTLAMYLARANQRVAMIEDNQIGGTCINVACIPTKTLVQSAKVAHYIHNAQNYGLEASLKPIDFKAIRSHKTAVVQAMREANRKQFLDSGMDLMLGRGYFIGPKQLEVELSTPRDGQKKLQLTADKIIINTGALPFIPSISGIHEVSYLTNDTLMELDKVPEHLLIMGGGYIGLEFAQLFRRLGAKVTVIEASPDFLNREDPDIAAEVLQTLRDEGIDVLLNTQVKAAQNEGSNVMLTLQQPSGVKKILGTDLLVSVGRVANTRGLQLDRAGVQLDDRGFIKVNEYLETTAEGIWALGDVKGGAQFTHLSWDDFRILKHNLSNPNHKVSAQGRLIPYTVFLDPELARIGLSESQANEQGYTVKIAKIPAAMIPRARTQGETKGVLKAVIDAKTGLILGATIFCAEGGEILGVIQLAMEFDIPYTKLANIMFAHPTMAEAINLWLV